MTTAYTLFLRQTVDEIVLYSRDTEKLIGEQLEFQHSLSFLGKTDIILAEELHEIKDCDVIIYTAGKAMVEGGTRLDLTKGNTNLAEDLIPEALQYSPNAVVLIVSNPVDILTYKVWQKTGLPFGRVLGTGTVLDTARFRLNLSQCVNVNPKSIHAYVLGEHGDHSFPVLSSASIGGLPLTAFPYCSLETVNSSYKKARDAAYVIKESKGASFYAISVVVNELVYAIVNDTKQIYPVSVPLDGKYGHDDVALSVPCVVGKQGVKNVLEIPLSEDEKSKLATTVTTLKVYL